MQVIENADGRKRTSLRERAHPRAFESISLTERATGERVTRIVRDRLEDGSQRVVIANAESELPREFVEHAFDALRYSALVCAPIGNGHIALIGMTEPQDALLAALEAAGLPIQSITPEERAMFATLSDEEVPRLIELRKRAATASPTDPTAGGATPTDPMVAESEVSTDPGGGAGQL